MSQVFKRSHATGNDRLVLITISDSAHHDGVTWIQQGPIDNDRSIAFRARCSVKTVERAIGALVAMRELEVRRARRGRSFVNVYRVVVGDIGRTGVEYDRLPFEIDEPFSTPEELLIRGTTSTRHPAGLKEAGSREPLDCAAPAHAQDSTRQVDGLSDGASGPVNPSEDRSSTPQLRPFNATDPSRARAGFLFDPKGDPTTDPSATAAASAAAAVDVLKLTSNMRRLGVGAKVKMEALSEPDRAEAWMLVALTESAVNPAGNFADGIRSGEWPSPRGAAGAKAARSESRRYYRERSLENLVREGGLEEARYLIDVEWENLAGAERAELHELVDELASAQLPEPVTSIRQQAETA